jgi:multidrug efflux pump subunit AcrA (membrane-fusion protein)
MGLAYIHIIEAGIKGNVELEDAFPAVAAGHLTEAISGRDYRCRRFQCRQCRSDSRERWRRSSRLQPALYSEPRSSTTPETPDLTTIVSLDPIYLDFDMSEADYAVYQHSAAARRSGANAVQISLDGERPWARTGDLDFLDNEIDRGSGTLHARATPSRDASL